MRTLTSTFHNFSRMVAKYNFVWIFVIIWSMFIAIFVNGGADFSRVEWTFQIISTVSHNDDHNFFLCVPQRAFSVDGCQTTTTTLDTVAPPSVTRLVPLTTFDFQGNNLYVRSRTSGTTLVISHLQGVDSPESLLTAFWTKLPFEVLTTVYTNLLWWLHNPDLDSIEIETWRLRNWTHVAWKPKTKNEWWIHFFKKKETLFFSSSRGQNQIVGNNNDSLYQFTFPHGKYLTYQSTVGRPPSGGLFYPPPLLSLLICGRVWA